MPDPRPTVLENLLNNMEHTLMQAGVNFVYCFTKYDKSDARFNKLIWVTNHDEKINYDAKFEKLLTTLVDEAAPVTPALAAEKEWPAESTDPIEKAVGDAIRTAVGSGWNVGFAYDYSADKHSNSGEPTGFFHFTADDTAANVSESHKRLDMLDEILTQWRNEQHHGRKKKLWVDIGDLENLPGFEGADFDYED